MKPDIYMLDLVIPKTVDKTLPNSPVFNLNREIPNQFFGAYCRGILIKNATKICGSLTFNNFSA